MKRLVILAFMIIVVYLSAEVPQWVFTKDGLRDALDETKDYLVLEVEGATASDLYGQAMRYVQETYLNPDDVIKGNTPDEYLRINTFVSSFFKYNNSGAKLDIDATYYIELRFRDGRVRYEIGDLKMKTKSNSLPVNYIGGTFSHSIYSNNGSIRKPESKTDIETYFNARVADLNKYLNNTDTVQDDW